MGKLKNMRRLYSRAVRGFFGVVAAVAVCAAAVLVWDGLNDELERADVALVLGNTVNPDGSLSERLSARLDETLDLYRQGYFSLVVVSGGTGKEGHDEAIAMQRYLVAEGVPVEQIIVDSEGVTTFASARKVRNIVRERRLRSVLVITQYFHVPRARLALERFGIEPVYSAHARLFEVRDLYSIPRELAGYLHYATRSYEVE